MLSDSYYSITVHFRENNQTAWNSYKAAAEELQTNINHDRHILASISVSVPNGSDSATVLASINSEISGLTLNINDWAATEIISGYTATTEGSQPVSVRFVGSSSNASLPISVTVVVAAASGGGGGATADAESDISTTSPKSLTLTAGYSEAGTVNLAPTPVENVGFTYAKTSGDDAFSISDAGVVTFATGKEASAEAYTATFTITATGSDTRSGTVTKTITVNVTVNAAVDSTAPTLSSVSASRTGETTATLEFTSNEAGTYYYLVLASDAGAPEAATVKLQGEAVAKGTSSALAAANTANIDGLVASTGYKAYVVVEDAAGNTSGVESADIAATP